uniref:Uncharacterized protein n=2 Tax=Oryza sativa subsp. japonica TaxID=39947 RepID=Q84SX1_ORYSJ|nr:hypothetical protein [Oryza sativa Japonica Group]ABF98177.1 hypothetical protein LOC_Os03g47390 [Oryza sativa Japonica Group]
MGMVTGDFSHIGGGDGVAKPDGGSPVAIPSRAWAKGGADGPAQPGTKCRSDRAGPMAGGPCLAVPGPGRAGWTFWLSIPGFAIEGCDSTRCKS